MQVGFWRDAGIPPLPAAPNGVSRQYMAAGGTILYGAPETGEGPGMRIRVSGKAYRHMQQCDPSGDRVTRRMASAPRVRPSIGDGRTRTSGPARWRCYRAQPAAWCGRPCTVRKGMAYNPDSRRPRPHGAALANWLLAGRRDAFPDLVLGPAVRGHRNGARGGRLPGGRHNGGVWAACGAFRASRHDTRMLEARRRRLACIVAAGSRPSRTGAGEPRRTPAERPLPSCAYIAARPR